jgi:hypothetical protein
MGNGHGSPMRFTWDSQRILSCIRIGFVSWAGRPNWGRSEVKYDMNDNANRHNSDRS